MSIDASNIDLYEVEFPHEPINVVMHGRCQQQAFLLSTL